MFKKILIANRGEIACRIISTLKLMNITSVAIYSEADRGALFTELADEAYHVGPAPAAQSYLNINAIIDICKKHQVEAVHPGYGLLAENPEFAERLKANNIIFIGPPSSCLKTLGDKIEAKKVARKLNVPILSGDLVPASTPEQAKEQALKLGFPILIKAVAGGGGKGMRRVEQASELSDAVQRAMGEAKSSFGDARIFIEKFLENPRHIEIQILGDTHGNIISLGERECSLQRRYQKLIEEAPSPCVDEKLRQKLSDEAKRLCAEVGYYSLGTVEFLLDDQKNYYFLEINPRIQVEHPVTELVTGLDLVEQQILVANGEKLKLTQKDIKLNGWAIEARVCAEDPKKGFMPSIGRITHYHAARGTDIRIDTGIIEGSEISPYYDSMIAKIIAYGTTREEARTNLIKQLNALSIRGVDHNISFLTAMAAHPEFKSGTFSTHFIESHFGAEFTPVLPQDALLDAILRFAAFKAYTDENNPDFILEYNSTRIKALIAPSSHCSADISLDDKKTISISIKDQPIYGHAYITSGGIDIGLTYHKQGYTYHIETMGCAIKVDALPSHIAQFQTHIPHKKAADKSQFVLSPMPGLLLSLAVNVGDTVRNGEPLAVVEAMKMENVIRAHREGKIVKLHVKPGESLTTDQPIIEFEQVGVG